MLAAKLCGKAAPGRRRRRAEPSSASAPRPAEPGPGAPAPTPAGRRRAVKPTPTPPRAAAAAGEVCGNGADDDNDGQTDLDDPGCADANDANETGEVAVSAGLPEQRLRRLRGRRSEAAFGAHQPLRRLHEGPRSTSPPASRPAPPMTGGGDWDCKPARRPLRDRDRQGRQADRHDGRADDAHRRRRSATARRRSRSIAPTARSPRYARRDRRLQELPVKPPKCANGKDDDGDGMIDDHFVEGATDPDPGCTSTTDTSENSELLPRRRLRDRRGAASRTTRRSPAGPPSGCGVIQGFWFRPPGTATDCRVPARRPTMAELGDCWTVREHGGTMLRQEDHAAARRRRRMTADADCRR